MQIKRQEEEMRQMFGKTKEIKKAEPEPEPKTEVLEVKMTLEDKVKTLEWMLIEYNTQYNGVFSKEDIKTLDADLTSLNILFAMFGELRIIREILSNQKK